MYDIPLLTTWAAAGSSLTLLVYLIVGKTSDSARQRVAGLRRGTPGQNSFQVAARGAESPGGQNDPRLGRLLQRRQAEKKAKQGFKQRVVQAGIYRKNAAFLFVAIRVTSFCSLLALGLLVGWLRIVPFWLSAGGGFLAGLLGTLAPSFWLDYLRYARQTKVRRALPDALDLISICLQGGLSLPASLTRVAMELGTAHPLLAIELGIVEREMQMGLSAGEAMRQFAKRFDLEELRSLASVIGQAERFGSSVTKALRSYAESLRSKRRQRAEELAQKAAVKILFPTLLCIFPGLFIVIMGPAAIRIYEVIIQGSPWSS